MTICKSKNLNQKFKSTIIRTRFIIPKGGNHFKLCYYSDGGHRIKFDNYSYPIPLSSLDFWEKQRNFIEIPANEAVLMPEFDF